MGFGFFFFFFAFLLFFFFFLLPFSPRSLVSDLGCPVRRSAIGGFGSLRLLLHGAGLVALARSTLEMGKEGDGASAAVAPVLSERQTCPTVTPGDGPDTRQRSDAPRGSASHSPGRAVTETPSSSAGMYHPTTSQPKHTGREEQDCSQQRSSLRRTEPVHQPGCHTFAKRSRVLFPDPKAEHCFHRERSQ